jgi:hypothetical protein
MQEFSIEICPHLNLAAAVFLSFGPNGRPMFDAECMAGPRTVSRPTKVRPSRRAERTRKYRVVELKLPCGHTPERGWMAPTSSPLPRATTSLNWSNSAETGESADAFYAIALIFRL